MKIRQERFVFDLLDNHPLLTQKKLDYLDYKEVLSLYRSKRHLTEQGFNKMLFLSSPPTAGKEV